jgi:hypothetical protein
MDGVKPSGSSCLKSELEDGFQLDNSRRGVAENKPNESSRLAGSRGIVEDAQDYILGNSQPSPWTSSGQALAGLFLDLIE